MSAVARAKVGVEARSVRSGEGNKRRATVELEARSERSSEGKERRATVGLDAKIVRSGKGRERSRASGEAEGAGPGLEPPSHFLRAWGLVASALKPGVGAHQTH